MLTFRKNILSVFTIFAAICFFSFSSIEVSANSSTYIKGTNVNVRKAPDVSSSLIGKLSNEKITILSRSSNWSKISCGKITGWVRNDFLTTQPNASANKTTAKNTINNVIKFGTIKGKNVNIREKPSTSSKVINRFSNSKVSILDQSGDWYKISCGKTIGWVSKDFILASKTKMSSRNVNTQSQQAKSSNVIKFASIKGKNVNIRQSPSKTAKVVTRLSNSKVSILGQSGDWYKISCGKTTGWVSKDFISASTSAAASKANSLRDRMILYSRNFLGVRYRYGGSTPSGFDCSGFTSYVYRNFGININRTANEQSKQGKYVPKDKLRCGDLVFFDTNGGKKKVVNHAGMYIGNGKFIHASSSRKEHAVKISSLNESFYAKAYVTGRTFVK